MARKEEGPDQARSWAIAMAGCVINSLLSGISRTNGLFYVALIETYGVSRMEANLPFTVRNVVRNLASPLTGAIGQRYGARDITFIGGIFGSAGIALCCLAPDVTWITILWGGIHGLGVALANTLFPVVINQYFIKYRATASGLSISGACVGSFVFPFALEYLLNHVGLFGTFLISGGFLMHVLPAAILLNEPPWIRRKVKSGKQETRDEGDNSLDIRDKTHNDRRVASLNNQTRVSSFTTSLKENKNAEMGRLQVVTRNARVFSRNGVDNPAFDGSKVDITEKTVESTEVNAQDIFLQEMRMRTISIGETSITYAPEMVTEEQERSLSKGIVKVIKDPMFLMISISLAGFSMLFDPAITVIVDFATDKGLKEDDAKYFISLMSLGDLIGRLCFGWVTDRKYMSVSKFMLLLQIVQGICFLLLPLFYNFYILLTIIMIYGTASGATLVMYPILVSKYLVSVQSLAIGFIAVFTGMLSFAVPPLIGYFRDNTGSYNGMFMITGSLSIVAGCLWLLEPLLVRFQKSLGNAPEENNS